MTYKEVLAEARKHIGPKCKACPECNGLGCGNTIPGPGSKAPGNGANDNWKAWRSYKLNMNTMVPNTPVDTGVKLFGRRIELPLLTGPIGSLRAQFHPEDDIRDYNRQCITACAQEGVFECFGDGLFDGVTEDAVEASKSCGGIGIPILNPFSQEEILKKIELCKAGDPAAIGIVIDSAGLPHLKSRPDAGTKTPEQIRKLKAAVDCPFIVKGVLNAKCAELAVDAGADAIIVSNHGGRVLPGAPATAEVLPEIAEAVGGKTKIIVDGGIRSGYDIFRAIALGADAVMICRPVLVSYYGGGTEAIRVYIQKLKDEFSDAMYMCGARKVSDIDGSMIRLSK